MRIREFMAAQAMLKTRGIATLTTGDHDRKGIAFAGEDAPVIFALMTQ